MIFDAGPPKWLTHSTQLWFVLLVGRSKKVHMLSFFRFMHFPLSGSPKRKGLFDCSVKIKNDLLQLFCGIPVKIGKNVYQFIHFVINFVKISSGKTKFSMASCFIIRGDGKKCTDFLKPKICCNQVTSHLLFHSIKMTP